MQNEANRLQTFYVPNFEFNDKSYAKLYANNGFVYTLLGDIIQCAFCRIVIAGANSFPYYIQDIHNRNSPNCSFVNKTSNNVFMLNDDVSEDIGTVRLLCKVCLTNEVNIMITDCKHLVLCEVCAKNKSIKTCPYCRRRITNKQKIYIP